MELPNVESRILSEWSMDGMMVWWPGEVIACKKTSTGELVYKVKYDAIPWMEVGSSIESHIFNKDGTLWDVQTKEEVDWMYQVRKNTDKPCEPVLAKAVGDILADSALDEEVSDAEEEEGEPLVPDPSNEVEYDPNHESTDEEDTLNNQTESDEEDSHIDMENNELDEDKVIQRDRTEWKKIRRSYNSTVSKKGFTDPSIVVRASNTISPSKHTLFCSRCNGHQSKDSFSKVQKRVEKDEFRCCVAHTAAAGFNHQLNENPTGGERVERSLVKE